MWLSKLMTLYMFGTFHYASYVTCVSTFSSRSFDEGKYFPACADWGPTPTSHFYRNQNAFHNICVSWHHNTSRCRRRRNSTTARTTIFFKPFFSTGSSDRKQRYPTRLRYSSHPPNYRRKPIPCGCIECSDRYSTDYDDAAYRGARRAGGMCSEAHRGLIFRPSRTTRADVRNICLNIVHQTNR